METSEEYQVDLHWKEDQNAEASSLLFDDKIQITENWCLSHSKKDTWTAEHLFIASILGSYMTAYLRTAKNKGIDYKSFKSTGRASFTISDDVSEITDILIRPTIVIIKSSQINKALKIFSLCRDHSLVLNALKIRIHIFPSVVLG
ncbi:OsmC family protein [Flavobacterium sp. ASV13]|uniref:OsmC family protein n=1 Tax=Flavobacterium sp. ASV13 TaxID=1506583 RepID=UPI0005533B68|nr:OsmC family protein [Flavobacterium sp. ASV13]